MERFGHIFHTKRVEILTIRGRKKESLCTSAVLVPIYEDWGRDIHPLPPSFGLEPQMTRALPFRVEVSDADLHGQPGAHMHAEKRDKARLWKDKNTSNCTCCMFVYIQKPSFILRTIFGFFSRKYIPVY